MEALRETTGGAFHPHVYLLDGTTLIAYQRHDTKEIKYFKNGIKGFDKRGRKFETVKPNPFKAPENAAKNATVEIKGSKGNSYFVNVEEKTCTCPGFTFHGACKHVAEIG